MGDNVDIQEIMLRIERNSRRQTNFARFQCFSTIIITVCFVAIVAFVLIAMPKITEMVTRAEGLITQAETVMNNLEVTSEALSKMDLTALTEDMVVLVDNVNELVTTSQEGVQQTLEKINMIDFEGLNQAIKDLSDVIEPLAKFVNTFKK